jgi:hypothetical protein
MRGLISEITSALFKSQSLEKGIHMQIRTKMSSFVKELQSYSVGRTKLQKNLKLADTNPKSEEKNIYDSVKAIFIGRLPHLGTHP